MGRSFDPATDAGASRKRRLLLAVGIALLAAILAYLLARREHLLHVQRLSPAVLAIALLSQLLSQLLWNGALLLPLRTGLQTLGFWELLMVRSGGSVVGSVVPFGGNVAVRMAYLKRRGLGYSDFTWATLTSNVVALSAAAAVGVFGAGMLWVKTGTASAPVLGLTAGVLIVGVGGVLALRLLPRLARHRWLARRRWLQSLGRGNETSRTTMLRVLALSLARHAFNFLTFGLLYGSLSSAANGFLTGGLVYVITSPIRTLTITPANLGVNEWVVAVVGKLLMFDLATGLFVALVFRAVAVAAQVSAVLVAGTWLALRGRRLENKRQETPNVP